LGLFVSQWNTSIHLVPIKFGIGEFYKKRVRHQHIADKLFFYITFYGQTKKHILCMRVCPTSTAVTIGHGAVVSACGLGLWVPSDTQQDDGSVLRFSGNCLLGLLEDLWVVLECTVGKMSSNV
jgi:hypothetical protein